VTPKSRNVSVRRFVETPDGLKIAVQEWAPKSDKRDVVLIHGYSQSHLCWRRQIDSGLGDLCRIVSYDLRGHGDSDKPDDPAAYGEPERWADEVHAVLTATACEKPILVGWSYAGRLILDYVHKYGTDALGGIVMVSATSGVGSAYRGPGAAWIPAMQADNLEDCCRAAITFTEGVTVAPLPQDDFRMLLAAAMAVPVYVRRYMYTRAPSYADALAAIACPTLIIHGDKDAIITLQMAHFTHQSVKGSTLSVYENVGHAPFIEDTDRFNAELEALVRQLAL